MHLAAYRLTAAPCVGRMPWHVGWSAELGVMVVRARLPLGHVIHRSGGLHPAVNEDQVVRLSPARDNRTIRSAELPSDRSKRCGFAHRRDGQVFVLADAAAASIVAINNALEVRPDGLGGIEDLGGAV